MKKSGVDTMTEEELKKILLIGKIKHYDDSVEYEDLVDYYITTGELPDDYELARKILSENDCKLTNTMI